MKREAAAGGHRTQLLDESHRQVPLCLSGGLMVGGGVSTLTLKQARPDLETGRVESPLWVHGLPISVGAATPPRWAHLKFTMKCKQSKGKGMSLDQASLLN